MTNLFKHLKIIRVHRRYVRKACFKMGLFWQGLTHDLSKYSLRELNICKYYSGKKSPHQEARDKMGYSPSWINHYHRNKHHWEYWLDDDENGQFKPIKIPYKYLIEMFCDFIGAGKAYNNEKWTTSAPLEYWNKYCEGKRLMHKDSIWLFLLLLNKLKEYNNEKDFYRWYKKHRLQLERSYANLRWL